jgi:hypothetical protein
LNIAVACAIKNKCVQLKKIFKIVIFPRVGTGMLGGQHCGAAWHDGSPEAMRPWQTLTQWIILDDIREYLGSSWWCIRPPILRQQRWPQPNWPKHCCGVEQDNSSERCQGQFVAAEMGERGVWPMN